MKKMLLIVGAFLLNVGVIFAAGWGINGGGTGIPGGGGGTGNWKPISPVSNLQYIGARFSLVYYDGTSYKTIGSPVDFWTIPPNIYDEYYGTAKTSSYLGTPKSYKGKFNIYPNKFNPGLFYEVSGAQNVKNVNEIFSERSNITYIQGQLKAWFGMSYEEIKAEAQKGRHIGSVTCSEGYKEQGDNFKCVGYRILVEPIVQFVVDNKPQWVAFTLSEASKFILQVNKQVAPKDTEGLGKWLKDYSQMLYTTYKDIGIEAGNLNFKTNAIKALAEPGIGLGVNIIDPTFETSSCSTVKNDIINSADIKYSLIKNDLKSDISQKAFLEKYKDKLNATLYTDKEGKTWTFKEFGTQCLIDKTGDNDDGGGTPEEKKYNCTPNINIGSCSSTNTSYNDYDISNKLTEKEYWDNCVFDDSKAKYDIVDHKKSDKNDPNTFYENTLGDKDYCEVYCIESMITNFEYDAKGIKAGFNFTWGNNNTVSGSRTCKTKAIDWDKYTTDTNNANKTMRDTYINWQLEILSNQSISNGSSSAQFDYTPAQSCGDGVTCGANEEDCTPKPPTYSCSCGGCNPITICSYSPQSSNVSFWGKNQRVDSWSRTYSGHISCPAASTFVNRTEENNRKSTYEKAQENSKGIINKMASCSTWKEENIYNLTPTGNISYSDTNYSYVKEVSTTKIYDKVTKDNDCKNIVATNYTSCDKSGCKTESKINKCSYYNATKESTIEYKIEDGVFQYVLKDNNLSIHKDELSKHMVNGIVPNYIDIGYSNFPVAFKTKNGYYGINQSNGGDLSFYYDNLGHNKSNNISVNNILSSKNNNYKTDDYKKWQCKFEVISDLITEEPGNPGNPDNPNNKGDINLIFRPIDLTNPFPGMIGSNRLVGSNWSDSKGNRQSNNEVVNEVITQNRGVQTEDIYKETPLYSFKLTPTIINKIRKYNKSNDYASYNSEEKFEGEYFKFTCTEGTGRNCVSDYLTYLINLTNAEGKCVVNKYRNFNDSANFNLCNKKD